ncbi:hypothetical protein SAMN05421847_0993 [Halpernia humi]|uniref:Uncharacterized protein n=1 Tax=Halpernia humi TaxID=493375 RepID=A0A1H5V082_9FLAO|nr:hypothetical protein [Halpernia humi]SEF80832.1 hypothetical protein SAMN05421847_0993 [Halpernia humi]
MKKVLLLAAFGVAGMISAKSAEICTSTLLNISGEEIVATECNTQSSQDEDGDNVSVTCCRTTYQEAYDCAAAKLRKACGLEEDPGQH